MENIEIIENSLGEQFVVINHGNDQFTSMPKAVYEAQQVEHLTNTNNNPIGGVN